MNALRFAGMAVVAMALVAIAWSQRDPDVTLSVNRSEDAIIVPAIIVPEAPQSHRTGLQFLTATGSALLISPAFLRVEIERGQFRSATIAVQAKAGTRIMAAETDCACLGVITPLPATVPASGQLDVTIKVSGIQGGTKTLTWRTSVGMAVSAVQVAIAGDDGGHNGNSAAMLTQLAESARLHNASAVWFIVHDLRGSIHNCGCSQGSLGGIDRLAALPAAWAKASSAISASTSARFLLSGDIDLPVTGGSAGAAPLSASGSGSGSASALVRALGSFHWQQDPSAVAVPMPASALIEQLGRETPRLLLTNDPAAPAHGRILTAIGDRGMATWAVMMDARGRPLNRILIPIDRSLPSDQSILTMIPRPATIAVDHHSNRSQSCATCHPAAFAVWENSRHARALASLKPEQRTGECIACHVTPAPASAVGSVANVHCQSCHPGGEAHAQSGGMLATAATHPTIDCRSCHDGKHHPAFDRAALWKVIEHK